MSPVVESQASAADLFEHALSYSSTREGILRHSAEFSAHIERLVGHFGVAGKLTTTVISWAKLYKRD